MTGAPRTYLCRFAVVLAALAAILTVVALVPAATAPVAAKAPQASGTFYVSPSGNDQSSGNSPETAWKTLSRLNRLAFAPGSNILLEGGKTFRGTLALTDDDRGTAEEPITIGSYGEGRATIKPPGWAGIWVRNTAGIRISDLDIVGPGPDTSSASGITVTNTRPGDVKLPHVEIERVDVSRFAQHGIHIDGKNGKSGFRDVRINEVSAHRNVLGGITVDGEFEADAAEYAHENVYVGHSRAYRNSGTPTEPKHTGNGIVISDVRGGVIEHSVAHRNGRQAAGERGGPVGIWAWDANRVVIQHNESYRNSVIGTDDGGGFDFDGGVSDSIMQHNYSHDNVGPGYLIMQLGHGMRPHTNNIVRHNRSENDARRNGDGAITLYAGVEDLELYGNEVTVGRGAQERKPFAALDEDQRVEVAAVAVTRPYIPQGAIWDEWRESTGTTFSRNVRIYDNRFETSGGVPAVRVTGKHPGLVFAENAYVSTGAPLEIAWQRGVYGTVDAWRAATGQEPAGGLPGRSDGGPGGLWFWLAVGLALFGLSGVGLRARRRRQLGLPAIPRPFGGRRVEAGADSEALPRVDLGKVTPEHLRSLGFSITQAARVVDYCERTGRIKSEDDVDELALPRELRQELKRQFRVEEEAVNQTASSASKSPAKAPAPGPTGEPSKRSRNHIVDFSSVTPKEAKAGRQLWLATVPKILPYTRPYWKLLAGSIVTTLFAALFTIAQPWPIALVIDDVLGSDGGGSGFLSGLAHAVAGDDRYLLLGFAIGAVFSLTALEGMTTLLNTYITTKLKLGMVLDFMSDLFQHLQRLGLTFHGKTKKGALMKRVNQAPAGLGDFVAGAAPIVQSLLTLLGMLAVAALINWQVALAATVIIPLLYYMIGVYNKRVIPQLRKAAKLEMRVMSTTHEAMHMLRLILTFGRERHEHARFVKEARNANAARMNVTLKQTLFSFGVSAATAAGTAIVLGLGALQVINGNISVGELVVLVTYIAAVYKPLQDLVSTISSLNEQLVTLGFALEVLEKDPEIADSSGARPLETVKGHVAFEDVSFRYEGRKKTLRNVTFSAEPGQRVAVVGRTGSGKSTLASLMVRFYDPAEGRVLVDGIDIRNVTQQSLREQVGVVLQEPLLLSGTIEDNIRYGRLDATEDEVIAAAKAADVHDFIADLKDGYATTLGERGPQLSGGEQQRICVARAFLKDAPILILDEPTSAVDAKTEGLIFEALEDLMVGRTSFVITHRLSTIRKADLILVMDRGRVVARGTHDDLFAENELYRSLYGLRAADEGGTRNTLTEQARPQVSVQPTSPVVFELAPVRRIRTQLQEKGELNVPLRNLLRRWEITDPTVADRMMIEQALTSEDVEFVPSLLDLQASDTVRLRLAASTAVKDDGPGRDGWRAVPPRLANGRTREHQS